MNIVLIGTRCSGKTTVGQLLAERTGKRFRDTDRLVEEAAGTSIEDLVSAEGWTGFRAMEKQAIRSIAAQDDQIIAAGGGTVLDEENVRNLARRAFMVWLDGEPAVLRARMKEEQRSGKVRPSLSGMDPVSEMQQVREARKPLYEKISDFRVDTSSIGPMETAIVIIEALQRRSEAAHHGR